MTEDQIRRKCNRLIFRLFKLTFREEINNSGAFDFNWDDDKKWLCAITKEFINWKWHGTFYSFRFIERKILKVRTQ